MHGPARRPQAFHGGEGEASCPGWFPPCRSRAWPEDGPGRFRLRPANSRDWSRPGDGSGPKVFGGEHRIERYDFADFDGRGCRGAPATDRSSSAVMQPMSFWTRLQNGQERRLTARVSGRRAPRSFAAGRRKFAVHRSSSPRMMFMDPKRSGMMSAT